MSRSVYLLFAAAGVLILATQALGVAVALFPFQVGMASWRFGAYGELTRRVTPLVVADLLLWIWAVDLGLEYRILVSRLAKLHLVLAAVAGLGAIGVAVDGARAYLDAATELRRAVAMAVAHHGVGAIGAAAYLLWSGVAGLRWGRRRPRSPEFLFAMGRDRHR